MRILSREELEGVLAHEFAPYQAQGYSRRHGCGNNCRRHQLSCADGAVGDDIRRAKQRRGEGSNPIAALVMMIVGPIASMMVQMAISRSREYGADAGGAEISGNPLHLAGALRKLQMASQRIPMDANPATSHMFIVNPLSGGGLLKLFSTHPPMEERIARLEAMRRS